jgi:sporulation integral membrane protein YtvI
MTLFALFVLGGVLSLLGSTLLREARALLDGAPVLLDALTDAVASLNERAALYAEACPPWLREGVTRSLARHAAEAGDLLQALTARTLAFLAERAAGLPTMFLSIATAVLALYFTLASLPELREGLRKRAPTGVTERLALLRGGVARTAAHWLRAELTLCGLTFCLVFAGLLLLRRPYALLLAVLTTLVDALPVFGAGTVLVPWAAGELLLGNAPLAAALAFIWLVTMTVRGVMEPKLLGAYSGVPPVLSLLAMYLGFRLCGVAGMVAFPFLLLLLFHLH